MSDLITALLISGGTMVWMALCSAPMWYPSIQDRRRRSRRRRADKQRDEERLFEWAHRTLNGRQE